MVYCTILLPYKSICLQITAEVSKITKSDQCNLNFNFNRISETATSFVKIRLVLEMKNVASFYVSK